MDTNRKLKLVKNANNNDSIIGSHLILLLARCPILLLLPSPCRASAGAGAGPIAAAGLPGLIAGLSLARGDNPDIIKKVVILYIML